VSFSRREFALRARPVLKSIGGGVQGVPVMVAIVLANAPQFVQNRDAGGFQKLGVADAGQFEKVW